MIGAMDISASALQAQRTRLDVIAGNIANAFVTGREDGAAEPYRRRVATFATGDAQGGPGVHVAEVGLDESPFALRWDPGHPHAIREGPQAGYVQFPNVSVTMEYIDALEASRAYEANLAMLSVSRNLVQQSLQLFA